MTYSIILTDHYASGPVETYILNRDLPDYNTAYNFARGAMRGYGHGLEVDEVREPSAEGLRTIGYDCFSVAYARGTLVLGVDRNKTLRRQIRIAQV
jgi:hypothetical protein